MGSSTRHIPQRFEVGVFCPPLAAIPFFPKPEKTMRRTPSIIAILAFLLFIVGWTQSTVKIHGLVLDAQGGRPLSEAAVHVCGTSYQAVTDHNGRFQIENLLAGEYALDVRLIGFQTEKHIPVRVSYDLTPELVVRLRPRIIEMGGLEIRAVRPGEGAAGNTITINREQISRSQARDVSDLLQQLSGIEIESSAAAKSVRVRGSQSNQVLFLLDGVRLNDPLTGSIDLTTLPLVSLQEIRVHKGGAASLHGNGAIGGVVELRSQNPQAREVSFTGNLSSFSGSGLTASVSGNLRRFAAQISMNHHYTLGDYIYRYHRGSAWVNENRRNADVRQDQIYARLGWEALRTRLNLTAQWLQSERGLPGQVYAWTPHGRAMSDRLLLQSSIIFARRNDGLQGSISWQKSGSEYRNHPAAEDPLRDRVVPAYWNQSQLHAGTAALEYWRQYGEHNRSVAGAEVTQTVYSDQDRLADAHPVGQAETKNAGVFARFESGTDWSATGGVRVQSGLRVDWTHTQNGRHGRGDCQMNPFISAAVHQRVVVDWQVHGSWSRAFRLPTYADLFYQQYRVTGNPSLRPEKSRNWELGLSANWRLQGDASLRVNYFSNRVDDLIIWRMGAFAAFSPVNTPAHLSGYEYEAFWQSTEKWLQLSVSHNAFTSENLSSEHSVHGKELPYRPRHASKMSVLFAPGALSLEYAWRRAGERFVTEANTVRLPGYEVHDVTLGFTFRFGGYTHTVKASLFNLTNRRYEMIENAPLPGREWRLAWHLAKG